ncbi:toxin-antitoxin system YwqK family antitoxin [Aquimarina sp. I32.4]|uniref:toxin-antitoxin system YwqK family antitoxin n=1 Tax=Aquimarina sp. I32.4 TaxID=2053903 RepID=UPI000CDF181C|nr:hypothetical protein [Aquimarina sp. I32.4]
MKKYIFYLIILSSFLSFSQTKVFEPIAKPIISYDIKIKNNSGVYLYKHKDGLNLLDGVYNIDIYIKNKNAGDIEIIENGLKKRTLKYDLSNSEYRRTEIKEKGKFHKGYKDGFWKTTYKNKLVKTENWNKGFIIGKYRVYDIKGNLLYQTNFGAKGNGKFKDFYYATGILKQEGNYENGKKQDEWCEYDKEGKLTKTVIYKEGMIVKDKTHLHF